MPIGVCAGCGNTMYVPNGGGKYYCYACKSKNGQASTRNSQVPTGVCAGCGKRINAPNDGKKYYCSKCSTKRGFAGTSKPISQKPARTNYSEEDMFAAFQHEDFDTFSAACNQLGVSNSDRILGMDQSGVNAVPLLVAVASLPDIRFTKYLISKGLSVTAADKHGYTPLHDVAKNPSHESAATIAKMLIDAGANIDARDETGYTPLMRAAQFGNAALAKTLLQSGAKPDLESHDWTMTALELAVNFSEKFLDELQLSKGQLPIYNKNDNLEIIEVLVAHGANIEHRGHQDVTPLMRAADGDHIRALRTLLRLGADANAIGAFGRRTALDYAMNNGPKVECVNALLAYGADFREVYRHGYMLAQVDVSGSRSIKVLNEDQVTRDLLKKENLVIFDPRAGSVLFGGR